MFVTVFLISNILNPSELSFVSAHCFTKQIIIVIKIKAYKASSFEVILVDYSSSKTLTTSLSNKETNSVLFDASKQTD